MAYTSAYEICNLALHKIGSPGITSAQFSSPGTNKAALAASIQYTPTLEAMLKAHPWRFAMKRVSFDIDNFTDTITATTAASPVVVTGTDISDAGIESGMAVGVYIYDTGIDDIDGNVWSVGTVTDGNQTLELYYPDFTTALDGSDFSTASSGYMYIAPFDEYQYAYKLPSDCLAPWHCRDNSKWTHEGKYLFSTSSIVYLQYIESVTDVSRFDPLFTMALATQLAVEFASEVADKTDMRLKLLEELERIVLPRAQRSNAFESFPIDKQHREDISEKSAWQKAGR